MKVTDPVAPVDPRIGKFDPELYARMRAASGTLRRLLLNRLVIENEPLVKILVGQILGRAERKTGQTPGRPGSSRRRFGGRLLGAEDLDWDDAMQAGRMGMAKALENLDLEKGKLSGYARTKIYYEMQCVLSTSTIVKVDRGRQDTVGATHFEEADAFEAVVHEHAVEEDGERASHGDVVAAAIDAATELEPIVVSFVRERLAFAPGFRVARSSVVGAFLGYAAAQRARAQASAYALGRAAQCVDASVSDLWPALQERGARPLRIRTPWCSSVPGLAGLRMSQPTHDDVP